MKKPKSRYFKKDSRKKKPALKSAKKKPARVKRIEVPSMTASDTVEVRPTMAYNYEPGGVTEPAPLDEATEPQPELGAA